RTHYDLHSFPTRRSSDLSGGKRFQARRRRQREAREQAARLLGFRSCTPLLGYWPAVTARRRTESRGLIVGSLIPRRAVFQGWARSEEHTSELQSRFDLVC